MGFNVEVCVCIPLRKNVTGKTGNSTMEVDVERCQFRPQRQNQTHHVLSEVLVTGKSSFWLTKFISWQLVLYFEVTLHLQVNVKRPGIFTLADEQVFAVSAGRSSTRTLLTCGWER
jgi:hypothetical protein